MSSERYDLTTTEKQALVGMHPDVWKALQKWLHNERAVESDKIDKNRDADARNESVGMRKAYQRMLGLKDEMQSELDNTRSKS